ncbi:MAG: response regulator transcription factor [Anaerolineales bacterium]|jgi:two-component system KDP operon response regulator KdpE|nr:response regulator transcription factor [Anaerolineales bacterium]
MSPDLERTRILVVDDEPKIVHLVREILTAAGYEVLAAFSGEHAVETAALEQPDLIILDIVLSGSLDGYQVAQRLRTFSETPIIMLTAKVREADVLGGFEAGADDYVTKPFSSKELLARVRAVLKRSRSGTQEPNQSELVCGELKIDLARRQVSRSGKRLHLTETEYNLLHVLAEHANQVVLHEQLLEMVWGSEYRSDVDYLRAYIHFLRQKIELDPGNPQILQRCPGVGYMLVCQET